MLDIDLEFLNFLLNPSYEYVESDIKTIQDAYLEDTPPTELDKKRKNFNQTMYLFYNSIDEIDYFLREFRTNLTKDIYNKFANFFKITIEDEYNFITENNFIGEILNNNKIYKFSGRDIEIKLLKNNIRNYLINIINTTNNDKYRNIANKASIYLDSLIKKYDDIYEILKPKITLINNLEEYKLNSAVEIMKEIMIENISLFSKKEKEFIYNSNDYEKIRYIFNNKLDFCIIENYKKYYTSTEMFTLAFINNLNNKKYISEGICYYDDEILDVIKDDVEKYNKIYNDKIKNYKNNLIIEELKKQLTKEVEKNNKILLPTSNHFNYIIEYIHQDLENNKNFGGTHSNINIDYLNQKYYISIITCKVLKTIKIENNKVSSAFYHNIAHELGHAYDGQLFNLYKIFRKEFNILGEKYVDYRSIKLIDNLIYSKKINKNSIFLSTYSTYSNYIFLLIDIFEKHKEYFDKYLKHDSMKPLGDLMGRDLLYEIISKIEEFDINKARTNEEYANYYLDYADNLLERIDTKQKNMMIDIMKKIISENNHLLHEHKKRMK